MIPEIPQINTGIPRITVNGTGIPFIRSPWTYNVGIRSINNIQLAELRPWEVAVPTTYGIDPPVVVNAGVPIVNMPGCVKVHKENAKRDPSRNKNLVNNDPKGNVVLCDAGMPYYEPPNYDARELTWQTVTPDQEEGDEGLNVDEPDLGTPESPGAPDTPTTDGPVECPPPNARRIGDRNQKGDEQVKEYKLTPDGKICETIWEPVPAVEQFLPSMGVVTTTATIATVATASALFAKPLADLLLKAVKPVVKKVMTKIQKLLGKKEERRPNLTERMTEKYREKRGLPPLKKKKGQSK